MEYLDFFRYTEQFPGQFAAAQSFREFAYSLDASNPGPGRLLQHIADKYPDSWEPYFRTIKRHGFVSRALLLPDACKVTDVLESAALYPSQNGIYRDQVNYVQKGAAFLSCTRNDSFAFFGPLGARYDWSPDWLKKGERIRRQSGGQQYLTAGIPSPALRAAWGDEKGEWRLGTIEAIRWSDGRQLLTGRAGNGYSYFWIAILPEYESAHYLLSEHEKGEVAAEQAARKEAFGANWTVSGRDRAQGAIGILEPFTVTVPAHSRDDAWQAAWSLRNGKGFGDSFIADSITEESE